MRFLHPEHDEHLELSTDDVFLSPAFWDGASRLETDLSPPDFAGSAHPIVSANMNAVTGKRMAETMARFGGLGVLPQDMDIDTVARIVAHIHAADARYDTALSVSPRATLRDVQGIIRKRSHDLVVVVDDERRPIGIITHADLRDRDQFTPASAIMSKRLITLPVGISNRDAFLRMEEARVKAAPVLDGEGRLVGVLGKDDAVRLELLRPALGKRGELMVAAAVGISGQSPDLAAKLVDIGVAAVVVDTAHGHQRRMLETLRAVSAVVKGRVPVVAGNVCTAEGTRALLDAGADVVKVNVGPGAMCTTRMMTAVGRPQFSAVLETSATARELGAHVWADGGVRYPRDVALALAAGGASVMIGSWFAGTIEAPGAIVSDERGALYKESWGMASTKAVTGRFERLDAFDRARKTLFAEGISSSRIYLDPLRPSVEDLLDMITTGLRSSFTYAGARTLAEFHDRALVGIQSAAGYEEGKALPVSW